MQTGWQLWNIRFFFIPKLVKIRIYLNYPMTVLGSKVIEKLACFTGMYMHNTDMPSSG